MVTRFFFLIISLTITFKYFAQVNPYLQIARIKYDGGGDWYNDPSAEVNLLRFIANNTSIMTNPQYSFVDLETNDIFNYPISFLAGHGNIVLSEKNLSVLREYFENGGFLIIDDDYGLDKSLRREINKLYPEKDFVEIPFSHEIYNCFYDFSKGPPKIHEHDNEAPRGYGLFLEGRMIIYYIKESK